MKDFSALDELFEFGVQRRVRVVKSQLKKIKKRMPSFKGTLADQMINDPRHMHKRRQAVGRYNRKGKQLDKLGRDAHPKRNWPDGLDMDDFSALDELHEFGSEAWTRKEGKRESGGLNQKGVESYRRANPGSKLKTAVTRDPSKLKKGGKSAKRRASFCARMKGMKRSRTSAKTANDPNSRINKSLRAWNC